VIQTASNNSNLDSKYLKVIRRRRITVSLLPVLAILLTILVACGAGDSNTIEIDGSSTVFPITQAVAEEFRKEHPHVQIPIGISGTGGGFRRFTTGETAISNASREIKDAEREQAAEHGVEFIEMAVAFDGLSVLVSTRNDFVDCLTTDEINKIWDRGSTVDNWSEVRDGFPDQTVRLYGPDTSSGTFDYFTKAINGQAQVSRADYTASADDNVLVQGIAGDKNSLGYFGYAYYKENEDKLKIVGVDNGNGCTSPTAETINSGSYAPLSRPLYLYINVEALQRPDVVAFLNFYLDNATELAQEVGYVGLSEAEYDVGRELIASYQ
jgi:phosphate transport system substrate-binding protein